MITHFKYLIYKKLIINKQYKTTKMNYRYENLGIDINFHIALHMSLNQLRYFSLRYKIFKKIFKNQAFWLERTKRFYPKTIQHNPEKILWSQFYLEAPLINKFCEDTRSLIMMDPYYLVKEVKQGNWLCLLYDWHDFATPI